MVGQAQTVAPLAASRSSSCVGHVGGVDERRARAEQPDVGQQLDRPQAVLRQALVDLAALLVGVDVHDHAAGLGVGGDLLQPVARHRPHAVRRQAHAASPTPAHPPAPGRRPRRDRRSGAGLGSAAAPAPARAYAVISITISMPASRRPRRWPSPSRCGRGRARRRAGGAGSGTRRRPCTRPPPSRGRAAARPRMRRRGRWRSRPAYMASRHVQKSSCGWAGSTRSTRPRSARWKAWLWAFTKPGQAQRGIGHRRILPDRCPRYPENGSCRGSASWPRSATARTGWNRLAWSPLEAEARAWFSRTATSIGLEVQQDGAGTLWAVTDDADRGPWVCAGSHLDTQPDGGAYDGALGVVARSRRRRRCSSPTPGAGIRWRWSRSSTRRARASARRPSPAWRITGRLDIDHVLEVMGDAPAIYGVTRDSLAQSREQLDRVRCFFEVHVEQGRSLADRELALGIADVLAPRQRWRVGFAGRGEPRRHHGDGATAATRCSTPPGSCWRSTRWRGPGRAPSARWAGWRSAPDRPTRSPATWPPRSTCARWSRRPSTRWSTELRGRFPDAEFSRESHNEGARFDAGLRAQLLAAAEARGIPAGDLPSYAGHDAGILAAARAGGDGVRAQPHRRQPHASRVGVRGRLPGRRPGADRRHPRRARGRLRPTEAGLSTLHPQACTVEVDNVWISSRKFPLSAPICLVNTGDRVDERLGKGAVSLFQSPQDRRQALAIRPLRPGVGR